MGMSTYPLIQPHCKPNLSSIYKSISLCVTCKHHSFRVSIFFKTATHQGRGFWASVDASNDCKKGSKCCPLCNRHQHNALENIGPHHTWLFTQLTRPMQLIWVDSHYYNTAELKTLKIQTTLKSVHQFICSSVILSEPNCVIKLNVRSSWYERQHKEYLPLWLVS